jgi:hypothetical protein
MQAWICAYVTSETEMDPPTQVILMYPVYLTSLCAAYLALSTVAAAFAEGIAKWRSLVGALLAVIGGGRVVPLVLLTKVAGDRIGYLRCAA